MAGKLTIENIQNKLGKRINISTVTEIDLPDAKIEELGSFANFTSLEIINLSGNYFKFSRQIEKLFDAPKLREVTFTGCPITKLTSYRKFCFDKCSTLELLDGKPNDSKPVESKPIEKKETIPTISEKEKKEILEEEQKRKNQEQEQKKKKIKEQEEQEKLRKEIIEQEKKREEEDKKNKKSIQTTIEKKQVPKVEVPKVEVPKVEVPKVEVKKEVKKEVKEIETRDPTIFKDKRTGLVIRDKFETVVEDEPKKKEQEKKNLVSFDSLFGVEKPKAFQEEEIDDSLFEIRDLDLSLKEKPKKPVSSGKMKIKSTTEDLFSFGSNQSKVDDDDDLFSLVDNKKEDLSTDFNLDINSYISNASSSTKKGLFE